MSHVFLYIKQKSYLTLMLIFTLAGAQTNDIKMEKDVLKFFSSHYKEPVIKKESINEFPGLSFYSVFEKKYMAEDPLIPDVLVVTSNNIFFPVEELEKALFSENIYPINQDEALNYARSLISYKYNTVYSVMDEQSFKEIIPQKYLQENYFPKIQYENGVYDVTICFYYPDNPYLPTYTIYTNQLVKYLVTINRADYSVTEIVEKDMNSNELSLNDILIEQICEEKLFEGLKSYFQQRQIYGLVDPPTAALAKENHKELNALWNEGFDPYKESINPKLEAMLKQNPEFRFDAAYIFERTKECTAIKDIEHYKNILEHLLGDIITRCNQ